MYSRVHVPKSFIYNTPMMGYVPYAQRVCVGAGVAAEGVTC